MTQRTHARDPRTGQCWPAAALLILLATAVHAQGPTLTVNAPPEVNPGDTVQVRVDLSQVANLSGLFFDVTYNPLELSVEGIASAGNLAEQGLFATNPETFPSSTGRVRFGFLHAEGLNTNGTLVTLTFKMAADAPSPMPLAVESSTALDPQAAAQTVTANGGAIKVLLAAVDLRTGYQIFTVPVSLTNGNPADVFETPAGSLKIATWDATLSDGQGGYVIYNGSNLTLAAGRAAWILLGEDRQLRVTQGRQIDAASPFQVSLTKGWNLVGNPFRQSMAWKVDQVRVRRGTEEKSLTEAQQAGWVEDYGWAWQQDAADPTTGKYVLVYDLAVIPGVTGELAAGRGCWVRAHEACDVIIPAAARGARSRRTAPPSGVWSVRLQARSGEGIAEATVGTASRGSRALAIGLPPEPPTGGTPLQLYSDNDGRPLAVDVRSSTAQSQEWELVVAPASGRSRDPRASEEVTIAWPDLRAVPKNTRLTLVDTQTGTRRYLRTTAGYTFQAGSEPRRFRLMAEPSTGPAIAVTDVQVVNGGARSGTRTVRFRLSAPAAVDVRVVSPAGRTVALPAQGRASDAGINHAAWTGDIAPGIYLVNVRATTEEGAAAQATCPVVVTR